MGIVQSFPAAVVNNLRLLSKVAHQNISELLSQWLSAFKNVLIKPNVTFQPYLLNYTYQQIELPPHLKQRIQKTIDTNATQNPVDVVETLITQIIGQESLSLEAIIVNLQQGTLADIAGQLAHLGESLPRGQSGCSGIILNVLSHEEFQWSHCLKLLAMLYPVCLCCSAETIQSKDAFKWNWQQLYLTQLPYLHQYFEHYRQTHAPITLIELTREFCEVGLPGDHVERFIFCPERTWNQNRGLLWNSESIQDYFEPYRDKLKRCLTEASTSALAIPSQGILAARADVYDILETFEEPPEELGEIIWHRAFYGPFQERDLAVRSLVRYSWAQERLIAALFEGTASVCKTAAKYLRHWQDLSTLETLKLAFKRETRIAVKEILIETLLSIGGESFLLTSHESIGDYFLYRGQQQLKRGLPKGLSWFPVESLPTVHWQELKTPISRDIMMGFIVQGYRCGKVTRLAELAHWKHLFNQDELAAFGQFVLKSWIAQDTRPAYSDDKAHEIAHQRATKDYQHQLRWQKQYPNLPISLPAPSYEKLYDSHLKRLLAKVDGDAMKEKGILSVTATTACGAASAALISHYLNKWYGKRMGGCLALLDVLSHSSTPESIQVLVSTAEKFRTRTLQQTADRKIDEILCRQNMTRTELLDQCVPVAGLNCQSQLILDYGPRQFTALLDDVLSWQITQNTGRVLKGLPRDNQKDDPQQVTFAKQTLKQTKQQVKQILKTQIHRLKTAMVTQRCWSYQKWEQHLHQHPILRRCCQRLVWAAMPDSSGPLLFRPLEDGSLTNLDDEAVNLEPDTPITLAHSVCASETLAKQWLEHLSDYEVTPLFPQFSRPLKSFKPAQIAAYQFLQSLEEFPDESIVKRAKALGYIQCKDSYSYRYSNGSSNSTDYHFEKAFIDIQRVVAIATYRYPNKPLKAGFYVYKGSGVTHGKRLSSLQPMKLPLDSIPPILLSEIWHDMHELMG